MQITLKDIASHSSKQFDKNNRAVIPSIRRVISAPNHDEDLDFALRRKEPKEDV